MTFPAPQPDPAQQFQAPPQQFAQGGPIPAGTPMPQFAQHPGYVQQPHFSGVPAPQAPPVAPTQTAQSFSDFWDQRSSGEGKALSFVGPDRRPLPFGTTHIFQVTRALTKGDVQHQTNQKGDPQFNRDGSPKWVLVIPGRTPAGEDVTWWCKGQAKTALQTELTKAGVTEPEAGSIIQVTYVRDKDNGKDFYPSKIVEVAYTRPQGTVAAPAPSKVADTVLANGGNHAEAAQAAVVAEKYAADVAALQAQPVADEAQAPQVAAPVPTPPPAAAPAAPAPAAGPVSDPNALFKQLLTD